MRSVRARRAASGSQSTPHEKPRFRDPTHPALCRLVQRFSAAVPCPARCSSGQPGGQGNPGAARVRQGGSRAAAGRQRSWPHPR